MQQISFLTNQIASDQQELNYQVAAAVSDLSRRLDESHSAQTALAGLLGPYRQISLEPTSAETNALSQPSQYPLVEPNENLHFPRSSSEYHVQRFQTVNTCLETCKCSCHVQKTVHVPSYLSRILGRGYMDSVGLPLRGNRCNDRTCKAPTAPCIKVAYILPTWVAMRMIYLRFTGSSPGGPDISIRVPRVLSEENPCFRTICEWDTVLFRSAIARGEFSPYDIFEDGESILWVSSAI